MKLTIKSSYLLLPSLLALAACTESDEPRRDIDAGRRQILFRADLPSVASRAEVLGTTLPYFHVTAFNPADSRLITDGVQKPHFSNERIDIVSGSGNLSSDRCVWPEQGRESDRLTFFAFYPELHSGAELTNASTATALDYKLTGFRVNPDILSQVDFVTAYTSGDMATYLFRGITLPFAHQLSCIEVKAHSGNKSCDLEIAGIRFGGIGVKGTFGFQPVEGGGSWVGEPERGIVEYVFRDGEAVVSLPNQSGPTSSSAVSIMGHARCAMLLPYDYSTEWDLAEDRRNTRKNTYISVLLRVTDATPTTGQNPADPQRYPYRDLSQGEDSMEVPVVYLAVSKAEGKVITRVYRKKEGTDAGTYFTDEGCTDPYELPADAEIREFGWAALPVTGNWEPGKIYTYTLDYTSGVGVHDPEVTTASPAAGDPVISEKVGITYTVKPWKDGGGKEFPVPGS